jgi:glycosyltransferase involved in cell wall biosynthesis
VRVCIVYDCLSPYTIGGAERWYRNLAERLAAAGHEVVYLTLRQWPRDEPPAIPGVQVVAVGPRLELYSHGRRRLVPPLVFGAGVLLHLLRRRRRYDVVHTASFPYFSVLAAGAARGGYRLVVDWHEVWSRSYWREYLGRAGFVGWRIQRRCARVRQTAFCFSRLHANRLRELGVCGEPRVLEGEYAGAPGTAPVPAELVVVFAGRQIPEKQVPALVRALPRAQELVPGLRARIFGDGPEHGLVLELVEALGLGDSVEVPGFVAADVVDSALRESLCLVLPSRREGYGLVVVEAAARGVPSVVVSGPDNAALELVDDGVNGFIAPTAEPDDLAEAIAQVHAGGEPLRRATAAWYRRNETRLSLEHSLERVLRAYETGVA